MFFCNDHHHADTAVEGARHLGPIELAVFLKPREYGRRDPGFFFHNGRHGIRQHARNILGQAAAGDVRHALHQSRMRRHQGEQGLHVDARGCQQIECQLLVAWRMKINAGSLDDFSNQRISIRMRATGRESEYDISRRNAVAGDDIFFFDQPDGEAGEVVFAFRIHRGHLGGFATNQRAARQLTSVRDAFDDIGRNRDIEFAAGKIIQKKYRLGTLHQNIVHAHRNQILAYGIVFVQMECEFELGADAIGTRYHHRVLEFLRHFHQRAKAADSAQHLRAHGALGEGLDVFDELIARVDIDTGFFVSQGSERICHGQCTTAGASG